MFLLLFKLSRNLERRILVDGVDHVDVAPFALPRDRYDLLADAARVSGGVPFVVLEAEEASHGRTAAVRPALDGQLGQFRVDDEERRVEQVGDGRVRGRFPEVVEQVQVEVVAAPLGGVLARVAVKHGKVALPACEKNILKVRPSLMGTPRE